MRRSLPWVVLAGLGAALPPACVLLLGRTLVWRDTAQLYAPHRTAIAEALRALRLPAWNPWESAGQPLFALGLHSVLHPVALALAFVAPSEDALLLALVIFAALGAFAAARMLELSPPAAAGAAVAFALSGFVLGMTGNTLYLAGSASGPWAVAGLAAAARQPRGWIAAAAGVGALALSGDAGALASFTLAGAALAFAEGRGAGLARAALGTAAGCALAAVQLAPTFLALGDTARGGGFLDPASLHRWALSPWRLPELVAPGLFVGAPRSYVAPVFAALAGGGLDRFPFSPSVFVGAPVLLLAAAGARRSVRARWLAALALFFLWLALGHHAGSQQLFSGVPAWGALRYWEKMAGPMTLCLALAAGAGIDALEGQQRTLLGAVVAGMGAALLCAVAAARLPLPTALTGNAAAVFRDHLRTASWLAAAGLAALSGALVLGERLPRMLAPALAAALFLQSAAGSPFALHAGRRSVLSVRPPPLAADAPGPRAVSPLGFDFEDGGGDLDAIDLLQWNEARSARPSTNVAARLDSLATYSGLTPLRWEMIFAAGDLFWPLARRFATTHVLARPPQSPEEAEVLQAATALATRTEALDQGALRVWEIPHRPWASFASSVRAAPSLEAAGELLGAEILSGRDTVVLEAPQAPPVSPGRVLSIAREPERVAIEAESAGPAVLVVNDAWARGWSASIDGAPAEILPADVLVRAVRWPAGRHSLVFSYRPPGLSLGLAVSGLAAAALLWRNRRTRPPPP